jgi:hypothetical protein
MSAVVDQVVLASSTHVALSCITNSQGQPVCNGTAAGLLAGFSGALLVVYLSILVLSFVAAVKVVTKAGYSGWWVLITFIPVIGTIFVFIFAFAPWPVTREVKMLRAQVAERRGYAGSRGLVASEVGPGGPTYGVPGSAGPVAEAPGQPSSGWSQLPTFGAFIAEGTVPVVTPPNVSRATAAPAAGLPVSGWYPNPGGAPGQLRYWDGANWTDQVR